MTPGPCPAPWRSTPGTPTIWPARSSWPCWPARWPSRFPAMPNGPPPCGCARASCRPLATPGSTPTRPGRPTLLRPERPLTAALQALLQPAQGAGFALSAYRASEYVLLLGLAEETRRHHPALYSRLQTRFQHRPVRDCEFHQALMRQIGSTDAPLPSGFAVPGDRVWLRPPPDPGGPETDRPVGGRWAIYLGQGHYREFELPTRLSDQAPWHSPKHTAHWQPMREFPRLLCPGSSDITL